MEIEVTVTNVLQEQAGIQYGSVTDKSEADPRDSMNNVLFTGEFKRGRFDQPMKVLASSIRAVLGYDPDNMDYVAIEDALAAGAPFVWVQRIQSTKQLICAHLHTVNSRNYANLESNSDLDTFVGNMTLALILNNGEKLPLSKSQYEITDNGETPVIFELNSNNTPHTGIEVCSSVPFVLGTWN